MAETPRVAPGPAAERDSRIDLMGMSMADLRVFAVETMQERPFRAKQLFKWIYQKRIADFLAMTDMSRDLRVRLAATARISRMDVVRLQRSGDGTVKFLWGLRDGLRIESVLIPEENRRTLCVSTQVGCPIGCDFCVTGRGGFSRNLDRGEILGQIVQARDEGPISNVVLMGMGEPLLNLDAVVDAMETAQDPDGLGLSHRKITLSTVGLVPQLQELGNRSRINIAISLHGTTDEQRDALIPINRRYPLGDLVAALRDYPLPHRKLVTIEYTLLRGVNDSLDDARRLVGLLRPVRSKVNLIPYNKNPFTDYERPLDRDIAAFQEVLMAHGIHTVVRLNRGEDIDAACGQLGGYAQGRPGRGGRADGGAG